MGSFFFLEKCCDCDKFFQYLMYILNMSFKEEIFKLFDETTSMLVFPTENAARYWLSGYARERGCSILASRAMAFDTFCEKFSPSDGRHPSDKYYRLTFTSSFLESGKTGMCYLYKDKFKAYYHRFVPFLMSILPSLEEADSVVIENKSLREDLGILKTAYRRFMDRNGLFEPLWVKSSVKNAGDMNGSYVLVGYDADIQMQKLMKDLGKVENITSLLLECPKKPDYMKFFTTEAEIEALFQRLQELKLQHVPTDDIIISTPAFDEIRPYLERKGIEYNIPLSFMRSPRLSETVPGKYLFGLRRCISEGLSFHSLEALLLNSSLPYKDKDMETNRRLIRFMIKHNHLSGSMVFSDDGLFGDLSRDAREEADESMLNLYRKLKSSLIAISRAENGDDLIRNLHGITTLLFGDEEFSLADPGDRDVYSFIFSCLSEMNRTLKECSLSIGNLFSVFMSDVENLSYVAQEKKAGIRVYEYGQDHLLDVPHHFLVGLNDSNATVSQTVMGFLEDHEVQGRQNHEIDVTAELLSYYQSLSPDAWISGSETSYSGSQSAPTYFVKQNAVREKPLPSLPPFYGKADRTSLDQASKTCLSPKGPDLAVDSLGDSVDPDDTRLSYTSISGYVRCPYSEYLRKKLLTTALDAFEPSKQDDQAIGTFLHEVIQAFMKNHFNELLEASALDSYKKEIEDLLDRHLAENREFDSYTKASIRSRYLESLTSVPSILLVPDSGKGFVGPFRPIRNEQPLDGNPNFKGFIDTVIEDRNGLIYLLDYKKGAGTATYQLVLYKRLYEQAEADKTVKDCFFYSMRDGSFKGFSGDSWKEQEEQLDKDIESTLAGYKAGNWIATPSKEACQGCQERVICRRRFNLQ